MSTLPNDSQPALWLWCLDRVELHAGPYLPGEVRLCLQRTRNLLETGADASAEWQQQERLFLIDNRMGSADGLVISAMDVSWMILVKLARAPRSAFGLDTTLASMARTACLRRLDAEHFASRTMSDAQALKLRPAQSDRIARAVEQAHQQELNLYQERACVGTPVEEVAHAC